MLQTYLSRWDLEPDGEKIVTGTSELLPVRRDGIPLVLKLALEPEEKRGGGLMPWWDGDGAARVIAHDHDVLLLERAMGSASLSAIARNGEDDEASRIICDVAAKLHMPRDRPPPAGLVPLDQWFRPLETMAASQGGIILEGAAAAHDLLRTAHDNVVLHGDIHHDNILDFGSRGWLAIDPKGLFGERAFDFANVFRNPDRADLSGNPDHTIATAPGRMARQAGIIADAAGLDRARLLQWVLAFASLSACWIIGDGDDPANDSQIATLAAAELRR